MYNYIWETSFHTKLKKFFYKIRLKWKIMDFELHEHWFYYMTRVFADWWVCINKVRYKAKDLTSLMESCDVFSRLRTFIAFHGQLCAKVYLATSVLGRSFQASCRLETCDSLRISFASTSATRFSAFFNPIIFITSLRMHILKKERKRGARKIFIFLFYVFMSIFQFIIRFFTRANL